MKLIVRLLASNTNFRTAFLKIETFTVPAGTNSM